MGCERAFEGVKGLEYLIKAEMLIKRLYDESDPRNIEVLYESGFTLLDNTDKWELTKEKLERANLFAHGNNIPDHLRMKAFYGKAFSSLSLGGQES